MFIGRHKYGLNKLKIGIGVCGAMLGLVAINTNTVHADAINWDNQNVKSDAVSANKVTNQSINNVKTSSVQSTQLNNQIKTSNVQAEQINKTKIAQFNSNSKIYGLNNSNDLSKNNGDGYVITNAGTFNGRPVDIGVTINNVQNNQGSYTTKWSNGDKAAQTGQVDNQFNYQNGVTVNSDALQPVAPNQTRTRTENKQVTVPVNGLWVLVNWSHSYGDDGVISNDDQYMTNSYIVDPKLIGDIMQQTNCNYQTALSKLGINLDKMTKTHAPINIKTSHHTSYVESSSKPVWPSESGSYVDLYEDGGVTAVDGGQTHVIIYHVNFDNNSKIPRTFVDGADDKTYVNVDLLRWPGGKSNNTNDIYYEYYDDPIADPGYPDGTMAGANGIGVSGSDAFDLVTADNKFDATKGDYQISWMPEYSGSDSSSNHYTVDRSSADQTGIKYIKWYSANDIAKYMVPDDQAYKVNVIQPVNVTDHLQIDQIKNGNLNYDYTIGLYDHNTGDLITSLKPEYKDGVKVGKTVTIADTVMNNAIKNKIADIRNNKAAVAFNGTAANDNVAFYQEITPVQDVSKLTATASRTITLHFPNNQKPASYDKLVDNNNQIVQTLRFTRTGTTDLVTGQTTYSSWSGSTKFPDIQLPKIPGFKLQIS